MTSVTKEEVKIAFYIGFIFAAFILAMLIHT